MLQKRDRCPTSLWETKGSQDKAFVNAPEEGPMPHVIVGDEAFPLKTCLLRPYPGKNLTGDQVIFNYRLSRARRIVENAFGILATRFRVYQRRIQLSPGHTQSMIQATIVLHNYLQKTSAGGTPDDCANRQGRPQGDGDGMRNLRRVASRPSNEATEVRNAFKEYFVSGGSVEWQRFLCFGLNHM